MRDVFPSTFILKNESSQQLYEYGWSVGDNREIVIGDPTPVVIEYVLKSRRVADGLVTEVAAKSAEVDLVPPAPMQEDAQEVLDLAERREGALSAVATLRARRIAAGEPLSPDLVNRANATLKAMGEDTVLTDDSEITDAGVRFLSWGARRVLRSSPRSRMPWVSGRSLGTPAMSQIPHNPPSGLNQTRRGTARRTVAQ